MIHFNKNDNGLMNNVMNNSSIETAKERFLSMNRHDIALAQLARDGKKQTIYPLHRAVIELSGYASVILAYACRACNFAEPQTEDIQGLKAITLPVALQLVKDGFTPQEIIAEEPRNNIRDILRATVNLYKDGYILVLAKLPNGMAVE